jgi:phage shock protein A
MFGRFGLIVRAKWNAMLNKVEDPRQNMDIASQEYDTLLVTTRRALARFTRDKKILELRLGQKNELIGKLTEGINGAVDDGNDALAEQGLQERLIHENARNALIEQIAKLDAQQTQAEQGIKVLEAQIARFKDEKVMFDAQYTAAESQEQLAEAFTGLGDSISSLGAILGRAQGQLEEKQAYGLAIGELVERNALPDMTQLTQGSPVMRELDQIAGKARVRDELAAIKAERKQIEPAKEEATT